MSDVNFNDDNDIYTYTKYCSILIVLILTYSYSVTNNSPFQDYSRTPDPGSVCLKTGWFSALLALGGGAMCLLGGALLATCSRLRRSAIDRALSASVPAAFNGYMAHKGRIN